MRLFDAVNRLTAAWPQTDTWPRLRGEAYGPGHIGRGYELVGRVLYAVTGTPEVEHRFMAEKYDLLVLHHPILPRFDHPFVILHTPFDCGVGGLNDLWRDALGLQDARHIVDNLGWYGKVPRQRWSKTGGLMTRVQNFAGPVDGQVYAPLAPFDTVAVCAGLGGWITAEVCATGADIFVTGELTQPASRVGCLGVIEVGHTRSERVGVVAIRRVLGPEVQVDVAPLGEDRFGGEVFRVS